jgi:hypothetical protein
MQKVAPMTTSQDAKELVRLCRTRRLQDVQKWIAEGKPLEASAPRKKTLLQIAVETGFHTLVELIAKQESDQASKNAALADAIALRRMVSVINTSNNAIVKTILSPSQRQRATAGGIV